MPRLLQAVMLFTVIFFSMYGGCSRPSDGCVKDTDCKGDRICSAGKCVQPGTQGNSSASKPGGSAQRHGQGPLPQTQGSGQPSVPSLPQGSPTAPLQTGNDPLAKVLQQQLNMMIQSMGTVSSMIGSQTLNVRITRIGPNGEIYAKVCVGKKCEDMDLSKPDGLQKLFSHLSSGVNDPLFQSYMMMMNQMIGQIRSGQTGQGGPSLPAVPGFQIPSAPPAQRVHRAPVPRVPSMGPVVQAPSMATSKIYDSWDAIQNARNGAKGGHATIAGLKVRNVSYPMVEFRDAGGHVYQLVVPDSSRTLITRLAKTLKPVTVTFTVSLVTDKVVRGTIESVSF